jgi:hypothetical protein
VQDHKTGELLSGTELGAHAAAFLVAGEAAGVEGPCKGNILSASAMQELLSMFAFGVKPESLPHRMF